MTKTGNIVSLPALSGDERVRVFRRDFSGMEEFANMEVDAYVVLSRRYAIVCDTLLCPTDMAEIMDILGPELIGGRQLMVVNSHADFDHCWGNSYFTGQHAAPILAHQQCRTRMLSEKAKTKLAEYQSHYDIFRNVVLTPPTLTFTHNLAIDGGDLTLELIPAPGHTSDHIAAWLPELRLLLAFDAIESPLPHIENTARVRPMFATLEHFLTLQPQHVLSSHSKTDNPALISTNLAYLHTIEDRCRTLLLKHHPADDELEHAADLIGYPFSEVIGATHETLDYTYYSQAHTDNIRSILLNLMRC